MNPYHAHEFIIVPAIDHIGLNSLAASRLVLGTWMVESKLRWVRQISDVKGTVGGPALGPGQMEPPTHDDIWQNFLKYKPDLARRVMEVHGVGAWPPGAPAMVGNWFYAAAMTRCHYRRRPEALPPPGNAEAMAKYHKHFYNTYLGATDPARSVKCFAAAIAITGGSDRGY